MRPLLLAAFLLSTTPTWAQKAGDKKVSCEASRTWEAFSYSPSRAKAKTAVEQVAKAAGGSEECSKVAALFTDRLRRLAEDIKEGAASKQGRTLSAEDALRVEDAWDVASDDDLGELNKAMVDHFRARFYPVRLNERLKSSPVLEAQSLPLTQPEEHVLKLFAAERKDILDSASKKAVADAAQAPASVPTATAAPTPKSAAASDPAAGCWQQYIKLLCNKGDNKKTPHCKTIEKRCHDMY